MTDPVAPDLVIVGAARSGTSFLSATLANHPRIDAGSVKEPNYYSSRWSQGADWYDGLFQPRSQGLLRVDGSVSYTYPQHDKALERIHEARPDVQLVYTVREPLARLASHYQLFRYYYDKADLGDLGHAIEHSAMFLGAGRYDHWLARMSELFPVEQILVVPFPATTKDVGATVNVLLARLGLPPADEELAAHTFRNEVRAYRVPGLRQAHQRVLRSRYYPTLRATIGPDRLRSLRQRITKPTTLPSAKEELASLTAAQRARVDQEAAAAITAVDGWLAGQDARLGLDWSSVWKAHVSPEPAR